MLYKKVHRQYLKEFREGRKFKHEFSSNVVCEITRGPYIRGNYICVDFVDYDYDDLVLIHMTGQYLGQIRYHEVITCLED